MARVKTSSDISALGSMLFTIMPHGQKHLSFHMVDSH